jgi:hypothetical protein
MADGSSKIVPESPAEAVTPAGINHLVINVRDMDESHNSGPRFSASDRSGNRAAARCAFIAAIIAAR